MIQQQITAKSVLSRVVKAVRLRLVNFELTESMRTTDVISMQRRALDVHRRELDHEEFRQQQKQAWLSAQKRRLELGL